MAIVKAYVVPAAVAIVLGYTALVGGAAIAAQAAGWKLRL